MNDPVLRFDNVTRAFAKKPPVLVNVSFQVAPGEIVGLLGANGAGKTTLIRMAMGVLFPDSGSARVFGLDPAREAVAVKRRVGYVSEDQILPANASVTEILRCYRALFPKWDSQLEREFLDRFQLPPKTSIGRLSKGQARQVALLCAICHRPELLLLDEPAGGLDPATRREFLEAAIRLLNREGTTILFSSHYMGDVERLGGRIVLLHEGRVRIDRDLDELREEACVVVLPSSVDSKEVERLPGCLQIRRVSDGWHAVFERTPEDVERMLRTNGWNQPVVCRRVPLEDLFVELESRREKINQ